MQETAIKPIHMSNPIKLSQNFNASEFDSPDMPGSGVNMSRTFIGDLQTARSYAGIPFIINSGYRSKKNNEKVGGMPDSSHLIGIACDIKIKSSRERFIILNALIRAGFDRIGIGKNFIHVDDDFMKDKRVIWMY